MPAKKKPENERCLSITREAMPWTTCIHIRIGERCTERDFNDGQPYTAHPKVSGDLNLGGGSLGLTAYINTERGTGLRWEPRGEPKSREARLIATCTSSKAPICATWRAPWTCWASASTSCAISRGYRAGLRRAHRAPGRRGRRQVDRD